MWCTYRILIVTQFKEVEYFLDKWYLSNFLQTYLVFICGHASVHLFSPVDTSLKQSVSFDPVLSREVLFGVGRRGVSSY